MKYIVAQIIFFGLGLFAFVYPTFAGLAFGIFLVLCCVYIVGRGIYNRHISSIIPNPKAEWINQQKENYL